MILTLANIQETLLNPRGRFRTLGDVIVPCDALGLPVFSVSTHTYTFPIEHGGRKYLLKYFFHPGSTEEENARTVASMLTSHASEYLMPSRYLDSEMVVFDDTDQLHLCNIFLQEMPEGEIFAEWLEARCAAEDRTSLSAVCVKLCHMGIWLLNGPFSHGNLKPSNLVVRPSSELALINYEYLSFNAEDNSDNLAVAVLVATSCLLASAPSLFRVVADNTHFRLLPLRKFLVQSATLFPDNARPFHQLLELIDKSHNTLRDKQALLDCLAGIAMEDRRPVVDVTALTAQFARSATDTPNLPRKPKPVLLTGYDWVGPMSDTLICVCRHDRYGFVDMSGNEVIPLNYEWADDFHEGRTVVLHDGLYGMIDRNGHEIIPAVYELLDWDCDNGIAKAMTEGQFGLLDRLGQNLTPFEYEWLGEMDSDLILAKRNGRYGYIRKNGTTAISFEFDDAHDFVDGRALVFRDGTSFYIDVEGKQLETP